MMKERNYGIDLLRIVLMFMVCMLHTLGQGGILSASAESTLHHKVFWLMEILCFCAVDGFALISGYMDSGKKLRYEKILEMWVQVVFYSFFLTLIFFLLGIYQEWDKQDFWRCLSPVIHGKFWYFTAYFCLFFIAPIGYNFVQNIDESVAKMFWILLFGLFSITGLFGDPFGLGAGYSAFWLFILYCMGALSRKIHLFEKKKTWVLILSWMGCIGITWTARFGFHYKQLVSYISPTIILSGIFMVVIFSRIILSSKAIVMVKAVTPIVFGIYLFQLNQVIWNEILSGAFGFVATKGIWQGVGLVFVFSISIFLCGLVVEAIRRWLYSICRIPSLCKFLAKRIEISVEKIGSVLK